MPAGPAEIGAGDDVIEKRSIGRIHGEPEQGVGRVEEVHNPKETSHGRRRDDSDIPGYTNEACARCLSAELPQ